MPSRDDLRGALRELFRPATVPDLDVDRIAQFFSRNGFGALRDLHDAETIRKQLQISLVASHKLAGLIEIAAAARKEVGLAEATIEAVCAELRLLNHEELCGVYFDDEGRIVNVATLAVGSIDQVSVSPYAALRPAFLFGARTMKLIHNHPSNTEELSATDLHFARLFGRAAREIGVTVESMLVVTADGVREHRI